MTKPISTPAPAVDPDRVIEELLIDCRDAVRSCIALGNDPDFEELRSELMGVAGRLMKTSLSLAKALKKDAGFTHRIIVERVEPPPLEFPAKQFMGCKPRGNRKIE